MSIKKNIESKIIASLKSQKPTCGDCVGFDCEIIRDKRLCQSAGIVDIQKPCRQFVPNTNNLSSLVAQEDTFIELARLVGQVNDNQLRHLGAVIMREKQTRNEGFGLGEKVYVRYRGLARSNYVSNFMSAFIMYADRNTVRVTSRDGKISMTFQGRARDAVMTADAFEPIREKMIKKGRYADPETQKAVSKHLRCLEEYELGLNEDIGKGEIPTIDKVFQSNKIKKVKGAGDLISIVNAIESGYQLGDKKKSKGNESTQDRPKKSKGSKLSGEIVEIDVT